MAAICAVIDYVDVKTIQKVAKEFKGVEHRLEFVGEKNGILFYNDSIASSPSRTIAGLLSFDRKVILIAGAMTKIYLMMKWDHILQRESNLCF